jgi:uncharacterized membrane protein
MESHPHTKNIWLIPAGIVILAFAVLAAWLVLTPPGLIGKLQAVAYSVCHENPAHTLKIGSRLLPLCARCTGMFLGGLLGLASLHALTHGAAYPARKVRLVLWLLVLFFAVDGINSVTFSFIDGRALYAPTNALRLLSGLGMGMVLAAVLLSLWRQTVDTAPDLSSGFNSWWQLSVALLVEVLLGLLILIAPIWLYYPIALLSVLSVPFLLAMVYTLLWTMMRNKENLLRNLHLRITYILLGCLTAFVQIGAFDLLRFTLTGTWAGIRF